MTRFSTVAITGASGFVGQHLSRWLLERDCVVLAVARHRHTIYPPGVVVREVPKSPSVLDLQAAFAGAISVVHLAGRAHVMRKTIDEPVEVYRPANVELTRSAIQAAAGVGCHTFLLASSVKAVGQRNDAPWNEESPTAPDDPYGISKLEAERLVAAEGARLGLRTVILRLPLVHGPGVGANMLRLIRAVDRGMPLPLGAVSNRRSLLYVGNAAAAMELGLLSAKAGSGLYFVSDGRDVSTPELVRAVAVALGRRAKLMAVPPALLTLAGRVGDGLARWRPSSVTSSVVRRLQDSLTVDITRIRTRLGYAPPFSLEEGLALTARWYRTGTSSA